ncbi:GntR family transcriptional regulator [Cryptosporangium sp. NPDC051539]|uniref:GntR family transcriptional regulator n=1 Tax=Cryptosporangium sp. NPDC051539 TaxID=3363962 RepID=UPI0037BD407D
MPESLSQQIYATLREGIIRGDYPQGSRLAEQRLAEKLEVSRVPLREAVPLLERDGFVETLPRRGAMVARWSIGAAKDLFDLRSVLEVGATVFAARRVATGGTVEPLARALKESEESVPRGDRYRIAQTRSAFSDAIVEVTGNALMSTLMRPISGRLTWLYFLTSELDVSDPVLGHQQLYRAISSGQERLAEAVSYARVEADRRDSLNALERIGVE